MVLYLFGAAFLLLVAVVLWLAHRLSLLSARASFAEQKLADTFKALSSDALENNNRQFLQLAQSALQPVKETLDKLDGGMRALEKERRGEQSALKAQIGALIDNEKQLRLETANLVKALRTPVARGRWGEIQLRRVVELAGMLSHCDFCEQISEGEEGKMRPDMLVRLPGGRQIVIDAKTPLDAYLDAIHAQSEEVRSAKLREHARFVRAHVMALSKKAYWEAFEPTPEFVVLFLPAETFFSAALEHDPSLIEIGVKEGVIIATPTTLIALLRAVAYGWKQQSLSRHAAEVSDLGHELYKRLGDMDDHFAKLGRALSTAVESYNKTVGSLESRVLTMARRFKELGAASVHRDLDLLEPIEKSIREIHSPE